MKTIRSIQVCLTLIAIATVWLISSGKLTSVSSYKSELSGNQLYSPKQNTLPSPEIDEFVTLNSIINQSIPPSITPKSRNIPNAKEWGVILYRARRGDADANATLQTLAKDSTIEKISRETAIRMLAKCEDTKSLITVLDLLADEDVNIRTTAFYSLPEEKRARDFDYTIHPTITSREQIERMKNEIAK